MQQPEDDKLTNGIFDEEEAEGTGGNEPDDLKPLLKKGKLLKQNDNVKFILQTTIYVRLYLQHCFKLTAH